MPTSKTLDDLGISYDQSARWQQLAEVPEDQFEAALAGPDKPTTSGIPRQDHNTHGAALDGSRRLLWF